MKKIKIITCIAICLFTTISINTFAEYHNRGDDSSRSDQIKNEPRIYTVEVEQACDAIFYNGGFEQFENCTYKSITYWNGYKQYDHKGNDISTSLDKENGLTRYRYTFTYETY